MEKLRAHYNLDAIKEAFSNINGLRITTTSLIQMNSLNPTKDDAVKVVQALTNKDFYKSMTSLRDHRIWQDVYHVPYGKLVLYVKFTVDEEGYFIISFKEK